MNTTEQECRMVALRGLIGSLFVFAGTGQAQPVPPKTPVPPPAVRLSGAVTAQDNQARTFTVVADNESMPPIKPGQTVTVDYSRSAIFLLSSDGKPNTILPEQVGHVEKVIAAVVSPDYLAWQAAYGSPAMAQSSRANYRQYQAGIYLPYGSIQIIRALTTEEKTEGIHLTGAAQPDPAINSRDLLQAELKKRVDIDKGTPQEIAQAFWKTILTECQTKPDSSTSLFYAEGTQGPNGNGLTIDMKVTEFKAPFSYPLSVANSTQADRLNTGLLWTAAGSFEADVYRSIKLHAVLDRFNVPQARVSYKTSWSPWKNTSAGIGGLFFANLGGAKSLKIWRDRSGTHISLGPVDMLTALEAAGYQRQATPFNWSPMACEVLTAADPFAKYKVDVRPYPPNSD
jgi:hypothetical protein